MYNVSTEISKRIKEKGPIPFDEFMEMALYLPSIGYYARPETEIGKAGDFFTSPHLHPIFGCMLGRQAEEMWGFMGKPDRFDLVEIGGGRGYLCLDILDSLKGKEIYHRLSYTVVEINPFLINRQRDLIVGHVDKVRWVSSISDLDGIAGCILSNEVLDALPVHLIEIDGGLREIYVALKDSGFTEQSGPPSSKAIGEYLREFSITLAEGYRTEVNLALKDWLRGVSKSLKEGFVLTIDYGYPAEDLYSEERTRGTLMCYYKHHLSENPYENIGAQDITAHVNFSSVKKWGDELGLKPMGFCSQGTYLVSSGIDEAITEFYGQSPDYGSHVAKIKGLIFPGTMGESHKVMVQYKGEGIPALRGFSMRNRINRL